MKFAKRVILCIALCIMVIIPSVTSAGTWTILNADLVTIGGFRWDISPDSAVDNDPVQGTTIASPPQSIFWFAGDSFAGGYHIFGGDGTPSGPPNPLVSGLIGTTVWNVDPATITLTNWAFLDYSGNPISGIQLTNLDLAGNTTWTVVPIPPTVLLLGAGLVGLVGIRRRVKS